MTREGWPQIAGRDRVALTSPGWMLGRWTQTYGEADARRIV